MAQCLSLSIIHLLQCNRRGWWIGDHISSSRPCMLACSPPLPSSEHTSSATDPAESDLGQGPTLLHHRSLMLLDCQGRRKHTQSISPSFGLWCTLKGMGRTNRAVWGCWTLLCVCVFDWRKHLCLCSHIKHDSQTDMEVAFGVVCPGELSRAWGDRTHSGSPLGSDGPCTVV